MELPLVSGILIGHDDLIFECKIVNIFLPISFKMCFGAQKNHLNETVF